MSQVLVAPPDPEWPRFFSAAASEIVAAFGANLLEIHHIGSTAIPGIYAKPVIDTLPVVGDLAMVDSCTEQMRSLGYEVMGEFGIPGRRYFRRDNAEGRRTHQIHAFQQGSPDILRHLAFRDFLRAHPDCARQYSDLKRKLAELYPHDIEAYMDGKHGFIQDVQRRALSWMNPSRA